MSAVAVRRSCPKGLCQRWDALFGQVCYRSTVVNDYSHTGVTAEYDKAKPFSQIPGPKGMPWFGSWWAYKRNPELVDRRQVLLKEMHKKYGDIVKETVAGRTFIHLFNPDFIKQVYDNEGKFPIIPPLLDAVRFHRVKNDLAPGLGNSNGEEWYRLRSIVQQMAVRPQSALDYLPCQNEVAKEFFQVLDSLIADNGEVANINNWIFRWGLESAAKIFLDQRLGYMDSGEGSARADRLIATQSRVFDISTKLWFALPFYRYLSTPSRRQVFEDEDYINRESNRLLTNALKEMEMEVDQSALSEDRFRFLTYLLQKGISERDISAVVRSFLTDTFSTTSQTMTFCLYTLATNPEVQEKVYQEAQSILSPSGELTRQGFNSSTYIKAFLKETFRFFPVGIDISRFSQSDMVIGGYQIPQGTFLLNEPMVSQHNPEYVKDPHVFAPERWLREESKYGGKHHPYVLIPFSVGTRMCAGRRFAEQELVLMVAKLVSGYRLEWHHGEMQQRFRMLQVFDEDVKVKFLPR